MKILTLTFVFLLNLSAFVYVNAKPKAKLTAQPGGQFEVNPSYIKISEDPNKGTYFLDPVNCEMKIIRQNLQISLVKDAETAQENFLIEFPNGRTVIGHIPPEKAKYAACFHSLSNETRPGYRVQVNNHAKDDASHGKDSHSKNTVLSGMDQCLTFAKNPKDQESRVVTNEITYIPNELYCENSNDCWASKSIVRIAKGAGLIFHKGYGPQDGSNITRKDLNIPESTRTKCTQNSMAGTGERVLRADSKTSSSPK